MGIYYGRKGHKFRERYRGMMDRCYNPNNDRYHRYGGRGIGVCDEWINDFEAFADYLESLGPCPEGYSMDRIDNSRNYEPGNIQWASDSDQNQNRDPFNIGEANPSSKLTEHDVRVVFAIDRLGFSRAEIARMFDVTPTSISNILLGKTWSHLGLVSS